MRSHHDLSIRRKLTAIVLVTCGVSILFACTMLAVYDVTAFRREIAVELVSTAGITGSNTTAALSFGDTNAADRTLNSLAAQTHIVAAAVYAADRSVFARYARTGADPQLVPPHAGPDLAGHLDQTAHTAWPLGRRKGPSFSAPIVPLAATASRSPPASLRDQLR